MEWHAIAKPYKTAAWVRRASLGSGKYNPNGETQIGVISGRAHYISLVEGNTLIATVGLDFTAARGETINLSEFTLRAVQ